MSNERISSLIRQIDCERLGDHVHYLAVDPLPFRKLNYTRPGQSKSTLEEADEYIEDWLRQWGYQLDREAVAVQAFRCDSSKPKAHQYAPPDPSDPWYTAYNLLGTRVGTDCPDQIIVICAHKDSQSWTDCPGAYDNAVGTAALLEMARVVSAIELPTTLRFLFCNEEHTPWTSITAAQNARIRGDKIIAVFNVDSIGGKSQADIDAGRKTNVTGYTTPEGKRLADLMAIVNADYGIGLIQRSFPRESPGDDDGSFVKAGYAAAVINVGSMPYADPHYHTEGDTADRVDIENVYMGTQATLAAVLSLAWGLPYGQESAPIGESTVSQM